MHFGVTAFEGKIGETQKSHACETLNVFYYKTQFWRRRLKVGIPYVELFIAGNFVTKKISKMQIEVVFTGCFGLVHLFLQ